jgi:ceramide glucosyltransferase
MILLIGTAGIFCGLALVIHLLSLTVAAFRCSPRPPHELQYASPVTLVRPVCGLDNFVADTLKSSFELDYPNYEIVFCVACANDPVVPIVRRLIEMYPGVPARLIVGDDQISGNPKLNNCVKGWHAAAYDWIVLADSNVLMPRDFLQRLLARWRDDTGLVCSPPLGGRPHGFWARLECAFLNTYQARWQYLADTIGFGFAHGKTMLWRREVLERAGGIRALASELAEDAASTKVVRAQGLNVRLVDAPFEQPLGRRSAKEVWQRQSRWARLRRSCFPLFFLPELFTGALFPLIACGYVAAALDWPIVPSVLALTAVWYGGEAVLARIAGWQATPVDTICAMVRDLLLPVLWLDGLLGKDFEWRGTQMSVAADSPAA